MENREKWGKLVVKSSVVPSDPRGQGTDDDDDDDDDDDECLFLICFV